MPAHDNPTGTMQNPHEAEAKARWGDTDAYKQSQDRMKNMSKEDFAAIGAESEEITKIIAALAAAGKASKDPTVQGQIARHYAWLRHFYDPSAEMYRGLGNMYVEDPRFAAHYEKYSAGLAAFMRDAMHAYAESL